jgi:NADH dehydrogenase
MMVIRKSTRKRILILGAGFAGLYTALHLERMLDKDTLAEVALVDQHYYHLFTPMLHEAATGVIQPGLIMTPIRRILRGKWIHFLHARVEHIDLEAREVTLCCRQMPYDVLVVALGSVSEFYGLDSIRQKALEIKGAQDADRLRCHVINRFEAATRESNPHRRKKLLTFVVVGGGCTGVETVTELHEYLEHLHKEQYSLIDPAEVQTVLVEAQSCVLSQMGHTLSEVALRRMEKMGIEVLLDASVTRFGEDGLEFANGRERLLADTVVWAAGVRASPLLADLSLEKDRMGRIVVGSDLRVPGHPEVYVLGDAAHAEHPRTGEVYPPTAQVAYRQAPVAAANIAADFQGGAHKQFDFTYIGDLVSLGRLSGVADPFRLRLRGFPAWLLWKFYYLVSLVGWQNRLRVALNWLLALVSPIDSSLPQQCPTDCMGELCL